ncbi:MAG: ABC transporter permease [Nitriliruptorales bacterium]|nr:ABC transporter permease [Nitriliruptorales bacterium]
MNRAGILRGTGLAASILVIAFFAVRGSDGSLSAQLFTDLFIDGLRRGGIFALAGLGLVLTYKATGVFNFAYGAIGALVAFVLWQLHLGWGWSLWIAAPLALLVFGPGVGVALERVVFRPLESRGAGVAEQLVATVGIYVITVGIAIRIWTASTKQAPKLFPDDPIAWTTPITVGGDRLVLRFGANQIGIIALAVLLSLALGFLFTRTALGTRIRAVVDRRELAELAAIDANRVSAFAWGMGAGLAGLTGVLLAPASFGVDAVRLPLVIIETFAVAVLARLTSLPRAILGGVFLGFISSFADAFSFGDITEYIGLSNSVTESVARLLDPLIPSIAVVVLLAALMFTRISGSIGRDDDGPGIVSRAVVAGRANPAVSRALKLAVILLFVALPLGLDTGSFGFAHRMVGLAIVLLSIVAVTGFSGHITLGQAGFAGLGGLLTARIHAGEFLGLPELPVIPSMLLAGLVCVFAGFFAAWPALRRRGLFLGLTTLAIGLVLQRFVFENFYFNAATRMSAEKPEGLDGDVAFYFFELVVLGIAVFVTNNLRRGRLGRILAAMRDSETASRSVGIGLRRYKLFIFSVSAFMAGIGGSLMTQGAEAFSSESYVAFLSLLWFAAVYVAGITSIYGALLAAALLTVFQVFVDLPGLSFLIVGLAALLLGKLPGGIVGLVQRVAFGRWVPAGLAEAYAAGSSASSSEAPDPLVATDFAGQVLEEADEARRSPALAGTEGRR